MYSFIHSFIYSFIHSLIIMTAIKRITIHYYYKQEALSTIHQRTQGGDSLNILLCEFPATAILLFF